MQLGRSPLTPSHCTVVSRLRSASSGPQRSRRTDRYAEIVTQATYSTQHELSQRIQTSIAIAAILVIGVSIVANGVTAGTLFPLIVFIAAAGFRRMKVEVNTATLTVAFDYGWPRRTVELANVVDVSTHRMRAIYGWGIRIVRNGTLWRAAGHDAVRLELSSGRYLYIGAADCEELAREISERLPAR